MAAFSAEMLAQARSKLAATAMPAESTDTTIQARREFDLGSGDSDEIGRYQAYVQSFNIEQWITRLGDATFDTAFVALTPEDARELLRLYSAGDAGGTGGELAPILPELAGRLQPVMDSMGRCCFVKTSSRSAKDHAPLEELRARYASARAALGRAGDAADVRENAALVAMSFASMEQLRMRDARRVLGIFAASERIFHDMHLALAQLDRGAPWAESLVVRRWAEIEPDMEFRCFVAGGRLVAVSQYRHLLHLPRLAANRGAVLRALRQFCDGVARARLAGAFARDDYVLDLALELAPEERGAAKVLESAPWGERDAISRVWVIEANPYFETTDGGLFSWSRDRAILLGERGEDAEPVFRVRERPAKGASSLIYGAWREVIDEFADADNGAAAAVAVE